MAKMRCLECGKMFDDEDDLYANGYVDACPDCLNGQFDPDINGGE